MVAEPPVKDAACDAFLLGNRPEEPPAGGSGCFVPLPPCVLAMITVRAGGRGEPCNDQKSLGNAFMLKIPYLTEV